MKIRGIVTLLVATIALLGSRAVVAGPETPFPHRTAQAFPWNNIQGVWSDSLEVGPRYSFEVQRDQSGQQVLRVALLNPYNGNLLAFGIARPTKGSNVLRALMRNANGQPDDLVVDVGSYASALSLWQPVTVVTLSELKKNDTKAFVVRRVIQTPMGDF